MSLPAGGSAGDMADKGSREQRRLERERQRVEEERRKHRRHDDDDDDDDNDDDHSDAELLRSLADLHLSEEGPAKHKGTGLIYDELFTHHKCEWDSNFPECPERVSEPFKRCQELGLVERCQRIPLSYATEDQIQWHHPLSHLELSKETVTMTPEQRKELAKKYDSWYANEATFECSLAAAGSAIQLMDQILQKKVTNGFAMVRPPGHHAMENEFCGYCTFNNVAFAATEALNRGIERVLIVDWDVHHGQGTQQMFYQDPRVLYFSIHRYEHGEFWPNLRESDYDFIGEGKGKGYNVNVPLNQTGLGDSDFMAIFHQLLMPLAYEFSPQVVILSSGYDAAVGCPEGEMQVTPAAYAHFVHLLSALCEGRLCTVLEGGYCLKSLSEGCAHTLRSLLRDPCPQLPPLPEPSDSIMSSILNVVKVLRPYWQCFHVLETLEQGESCPFDEVNTSPPKEGIEFATPDNRPAEYEIMGCYPQQSAEVIKKFQREIDRLIAETSLATAPYRTCFVFDAAMRKHKNPFDGTHPERPKRISSIFDKHREWGLLSRCLQLESRSATDEEILTVHKEQYLEAMKESASMEDEALRSRPREKKYNSIYMCQDSYNCALLSAGCVLQVTEAVLSGKAQNGVAVVRPPGHHAECNAAMGFCFFNNVAIAAACAQRKFGIKRILILDWDVHHGNATQHMFYNDPSVLYISLHRYENGSFFPGSREAGHTHVGKDTGRGLNVNIPWSNERMGDAEYMAAFQRIVMPIAYEFAPELVLVSAGFDAAAGDFLGGFRVMPECYGHMTHMLSGLANGKVVLALEGGYNTTSISVSMATCTSVLLGDPCPLIQPDPPNCSAVETIREVLQVQKDFWKSLKFAVKIPSMENEAAILNSPLICGNNQSVSGDNVATAFSEGDRKQEGQGDASTKLEAVTAAEGSASFSETTVQPSHDAGTPREPAKPATLGDSESRSQVKLKPDGDKTNTTSDDSADTLVTATQTLSLTTAGDTDQETSDMAGKENTTEKKTEGMEGGPSTEGGGATAGAGGGEEELMGACGGAWRPNTVEDILKMQGVEQLYAVEPLPWCPHLTAVGPLPPQGLDTGLPCEDCADRSENWVCLTCYKVFCSRYVQEHMLFHSVATEHVVVLSYSDLSVWCYACNDYVDNQITHPMKNAAHSHKFGEPLPNPGLMMQ